MSKILLIAIALIMISAVFIFRDRLPFQQKSLQSNLVTEKSTGPLEEIRIGVSKVAPELSTLIYIADKKGFFTEEGLKPVITTEENGNIAQKKVSEASLDIGTTPEFAFVSDSFEDTNLRVIAIAGYANIVDLLFKKTQGIDTSADLKGKKIAVPLKSSLEFFLGRYLTLNNLSVREVVIVDTPFKDLQASIASDKVDAVVANDPFAFQIKSTLKDNLTVWPIQEGQEITWLLVSNQDFLKTHPQKIEKLLKALIKAREFVDKNERESKEIVKKHLNLEQIYIDQSWPKHRFSVSLEQSLLLAMEDEARWRIENKLTTKKEVPNYLNLIHFDGLEKVKPESITIIR